jgi:hypothetical protein
VRMICPQNSEWFLTRLGFGDTNAIRRALLERNRDSADFEVIVTPSKRVTTDRIQQRYIDRSLKRRGAARTVIVTNRSDVSNSCASPRLISFMLTL